MAITIGGVTIPLSYPLEQENFLEDFMGMFDGSGVNITSGAAAVASAAVVGRIFNINSMGALAGTTYSLPAAVGSGVRIMFYVSALATSLNHIIKTSPNTDNFIGIIAGMNNSTGAVTAFAAAATSNTVTLNRAGTGSVSLGEHVECTDVAAATWLVRGFLSASAAAFTTPFSHV
jgi:hypothetical protein